MRTLVIAEAGVNHNGSLDLALRMVDVAVEAGADIVKFQSFKAEKLASVHAPKASYQIETTGQKESQFEMLKRLEFTEENHLAVLEYCAKVGIEFLSTPFDIDSLNFLHKECGIKRIKLGSGDLNNAPLLFRAGEIGLPLILSTGMSDLAEIREALSVVALAGTKPAGKLARASFDGAFSSDSGQKFLRDKVTLLHCVTQYPAPFQDLNLSAMESMKKQFGLGVGYSDHSLGIHACIAATAMGAKVIEKHFTLDRNMEGPDHRASLEPAELKEMIRSIRDIEAALGDGEKKPMKSEIANRAIARRSLVALAEIRAGEKFTQANLGVKRPGSGVSPFLFWDLLGTEATRGYKADELIE